MANYREIVTKAVIGKGKKIFKDKHTLTVEQTPSTILGCWVINHNFSGHPQQEKVALEGSYDINIWYSYDNDTKTAVAKDKVQYNDLVTVTKKRESDSNEEVIIRSLNQPACSNVKIEGNQISYEVEKELGIELVGDTKVRIEVDDGYDDWEDIKDEEKEEDIMKEIDENVDENFIDEKK